MGPGARPAPLPPGVGRCARPRPRPLSTAPPPVVAHISVRVLSQDLSPEPPPLTWTSSADGTEVVSAAPAPGPPRQLVEELQSRYRQMEERITCPICIDSHIRLVFQCGHGACAPCGAALSACPICRQPIRDRIQIFV